MPAVKKIKIYTSNRNFLTADIGAVKKARNFFEQITYLFFAFFYLVGLGVLKTARGILMVCFYTGSWVVNFTISTYRGARNDIIKTKTTFGYRTELLFSRQFLRSLAMFALVAALGWGAVTSLGLIAKAINLKDRIIRTALIGNLYLDQAKNSLAAQDFSGAGNKFSLAYKTFTQSRDDMQQSSKALQGLLNLVPQKQDADRLLEAARLISSAGQDFIILSDHASGFKITAQGLQSSPSTTGQQNLKEIQNDINVIQRKIELANFNINNVNENNLPQDRRGQFLELKNKLNTADLALKNLQTMTNFVVTALSGEKTLLVLFENNNELRAAGGFPGTYGLIKLTDGRISSLKISSIYDLDGQLKEIIRPPGPLSNVNDRWYLRDSTWFADFPQSARKVMSFYEKEGGETPDMVLALTPNLIVDWLKITGPVKLNNPPLTLNADNFVEIIQAATTESQNLPTNAPKQPLADLFPLLLQKISALSEADFAAIIFSIQQNLNNKQVALFARDPALQKQILNLRWSGEIIDTDRDYLAVVASNLGGTKTDLAIEQQIKLTTSISADGSLINDLEITRTNKMPKLKGTRNESYLRIFVPEGSQLLSNIGFDAKSLSFPADLNYKIDEDLREIEKTSSIDVVSQTTVGREAGKTFFGNWQILEGGESKTIKLSYKLPFKLNSIDRFSLLFQKQIGGNNSKVNWQLNFPNRQTVWQNFDPSKTDTDTISSDILLDKDYFLGLVLQKR